VNGTLRRLGGALLIAAASVLAGCATVPATADTPVADPWESWNRKVFAFNDKVDEAVLKPVATGYRNTVPRLVRNGVSNFFGNIGDLWSAANHVLQGKFASGMEMGFRVLTNTLLGFGGVLDPATEFGMTRRSEDFGQTLGRWGVPSGPFVVLPLFGPSTLRDTVGLLADRQASAGALIESDAERYRLLGLEIVNGRANLLDTTRLVDQVALDRYSFLRDAYLQRRRDALYDGSPPLLPEDPGDDPPAKTPAKPAGAATR
jgi:phospholipid-binding lipoprotein MlaA